MYRQRKVCAVVVAAGSSSRMGFDKLMVQIDGVEVLRRSVARFDEHPYIDNIVVVAGQNIAAVEALFGQYPTQKPIVIVPGGQTRADSVAAGVIACANTSLVAIHDGARPFVPEGVITSAIEAAGEYGAAAPAIPVKDTIKRAQNGIVQETLPRDALRAVQTPQVFDCASFSRALAATPAEARAQLTDDCMIMERAGVPVRLVAGDEANRKITTPEDLRGLALERGSERAVAQPTPPASQRLPRIGHGYDVHKLVQGRPLIMGGVNIPCHMGLLGHSDADVLLHAVSDALLGAAALGDIGKHFPDNDERYRGADSLVLLHRAAELVWQTGHRVANVDATILCQAPKLRPHIDAMRANIADAVGVGLEDVSVKATTEEGLGFTGSSQGIAAHCVAMLAPL